MNSYFIYYTESTIVCLIIFGIMLMSDLYNVDRQEKQVKYDRALIAFMLYFISDEMWAAVIGGIIPRNEMTVAGANFLNYLFMANITYSWLQYIMAVEQVAHRNRSINRFAVAFPFYVVTIVLVATYLIRPRVLITEDNDITVVSTVFQLLVPIIYIVAIMVYTMKRAIESENSIEKRRHYYIGFFPLMVVAGGMIQVIFLPQISMFCYCCTILMLIFYIQSMEGQISVDALTGLNNRGQILRYTSQQSALHREGRRTFAAMIDANSFKSINDTYGHAEGDRALVMIADSMRAAVRDSDLPVFIGRYGGDEFLMIAYVEHEQQIRVLIEDIHTQLRLICEAADTPYILTVSIGCSELKNSGDSFQKCLERADHALYIEKQKRRSIGADPDDGAGDNAGAMGIA